MIKNHLSSRHFITPPGCDIIKRMPYRLVPFVSGYYYHIFNRGVEKRVIFSTNRDYQRFLETLYYYQFSGPKPRFSTHHRFKIKDFSNNPKIVEIVSYCLMPNHFHLLIKQLEEGGTQEFMGKMTNSYTKYYNTKHNRIGPLLQGVFKAVSMESDEQLLHVSRYIHLNPFVSDLTKDLKSYNHSSYPAFIGLTNDPIVEKEPILGFFKEDGENKYKEFVDDHSGYAQELEYYKHLLLDTE